MRRPESSKDLAGDGGLGTPVKWGGSASSVNFEASGELARSAFSLTGGSNGVGSEMTSSPSRPGALDWSSSFTIDCLFLSLSSSSSSSAISTNRRRRNELVEEDVEPDAACKEQAAESLVSFSSFASLIEKAVSKGENRSQTELK